MIKNKIEIEILLTDKGNIRINHGGGSVLVKDCLENMSLIPFLEVTLLNSLKIIDKMNLKAGDRIKTIGSCGTITRANKYDDFVTVLMDDDNRSLDVFRKDLEIINK